MDPEISNETTSPGSKASTRQRPHRRCHVAPAPSPAPAPASDSTTARVLVPGSVNLSASRLMAGLAPVPAPDLTVAPVSAPVPASVPESSHTPALVPVSGPTSLPPARPLVPTAASSGPASCSFLQLAVSLDPANCSSAFQPDAPAASLRPASCHPVTEPALPAASRDPASCYPAQPVPASSGPVNCSPAGRSAPTVGGPGPAQQPSDSETYAFSYP